MAKDPMTQKKSTRLSMSFANKALAELTAHLVGLEMRAALAEDRELRGFAAPVQVPTYAQPVI